MGMGTHRRPLAVAHRAGNSLVALREAAALGADVIEVDVAAHLGRLEVRHARTAGPLLVDGWRIRRGWGRRLQLADVLAEAMTVAGAGTRLMLDLKGSDPRLGTAVAAAVHAVVPHRDLIVCGRHWPSLTAFDDVPYALVAFSAGTRSELAALLMAVHDPTRPPPAGACVHRSLLTTGVVGRLHERVDTVLTWPINDVKALDDALATGVDAVITDEAAILRRVLTTGR